MSHSDLHSTAADCGVELGATVTSADGKRLGTVNDMRGPYFKVHRGFLASDYWVEVNDVVAVLDDEVMLTFEKRAATDHQVPADIVTDERLDARADHLLDDAAVAEQRERMERELGEHR
jgi:hypothetical protein